MMKLEALFVDETLSVELIRLGIAADCIVGMDWLNDVDLTSFTVGGDGWSHRSGRSEFELEGRQPDSFKLTEFEIDAAQERV